MIIAVSVGGGHIGRIHMRKPIVGGNFAGSVEYQSPQRITLVGIGVDSPVLLVEIFGNRLVHADGDFFIVSSFTSFFNASSITPSPSSASTLPPGTDQAPGAWKSVLLLFAKRILPSF